VAEFLTRIALGIEYDGSAFSGWQTQLSPRLRTVQESLEQALSSVADHPVTVHCAGRTDAGVHASGQVVHFDARVERPLKAWVLGGNGLLPSQIAVQWAQVVPADFHARFSALSRRYRYLICNSPVKPALYHHFLTHHRYPLDAELMHAAGQHLLGEQDFTSFRAVACQSRTPMRNVMQLNVRREGQYVAVEIEANAFLLHMVRNIVGALLEVGEGRKPVSWTAELLALRDRTKAAPTAAPNGLSLIRVRYPSALGFPEPAAPPMLP
jgi:tRNA pseudouridine38-40 synthase